MERREKSWTARTQMRCSVDASLCWKGVAGCQEESSCTDSSPGNRWCNEKSDGRPSWSANREAKWAAACTVLSSVVRRQRVRRQTHRAGSCTQCTRAVLARSRGVRRSSWVQRYPELPRCRVPGARLCASTALGQCDLGTRVGAKIRARRGATRESGCVVRCTAQRDAPRTRPYYCTVCNKDL